MINIIFDKYRLLIEDSTNTGYARILYLKNLILVANDNITELTILDNNGKLLYTFDSTNSTYTNFTYLGDLVGYALSIGSETNFNQFIRQDTLTLVDYHYIYVLDSDEKSYVYYNDEFNVIPDVGGTSNTAGDWIDITDGVVSFLGGEVTNKKYLITTLSAEVDGITYKGTVDRLLSVSEGDKFLHSLVDETNEKTLNSSITRVKSTDFSYLVSKYEDGVSVGDTVLGVAIDQITLSTADGTYGNTLSFKSTDTSISAYPNTRNDFPTGDPVNLLTTDANGKIQSFNTGITADISVLGTTLRFANGILVEYRP